MRLGHEDTAIIVINIAIIAITTIVITTIVITTISAETELEEDAAELEEDAAELEEDAAELPNKQHLESEQEETLMMGVSGRG